MKKGPFGPFFVAKKHSFPKMKFLFSFFFLLLLKKCSVFKVAEERSFPVLFSLIAYVHQTIPGKGPGRCDFMTYPDEGRES